MAKQRTADVLRAFEIVQFFYIQNVYPFPMIDYDVL